MLARLTATTDLTGLSVEHLSAPARGMDGDAVGVVGVAAAGVVGVMVAAAGATDMAITEAAALPADADMPAVRLVDSTVAAGSMAALWPTAVADSTVVAAAGSTAAVVDTAVVDTAAADTGRRGGSGVS
jgi:uncharacterized ferredoxin-like protein